ncbi:MAG TPA: hypothetical protein PK833_03450 [Vicingus sp.]|nr:hypothetical protein [Vicingus sp.]
MATLLKFLAWFGVLIIIGYAIQWTGTNNEIMIGIANASITIGWSVFWAIALIFRVIAEVIFAILEVIVNFIQGQASWLPDVPRIF